MINMVNVFFNILLQRNGLPTTLIRIELLLILLFLIYIQFHALNLLQFLFHWILLQFLFHFTLDFLMLNRLIPQFHFHLFLEHILVAWKYLISFFFLDVFFFHFLALVQVEGFRFAHCFLFFLDCFFEFFVFVLLLREVAYSLVLSVYFVHVVLFLLFSHLHFPHFYVLALSQICFST